MSNFMQIKPTGSQLISSKNPHTQSRDFLILGTCRDYRILPRIWDWPKNTGTTTIRRAGVGHPFTHQL